MIARAPGEWIERYGVLWSSEADRYPEHLAVGWRLAERLQQ
jgi:hypothetical protein